MESIVCGKNKIEVIGDCVVFKNLSIGFISAVHRNEIKMFSVSYIHDNKQDYIEVTIGSNYKHFLNMPEYMDKEKGLDLHDRITILLVEIISKNEMEIV